MTMLIGRIVALALVCAAPLAHAATYRCSSGGSTVLSDRPCSEPNKTELRAYGPATPSYGSTRSSQLPDPPKAQEYIQYLPSGCASIAEAIRTAPARGVRGDVVRGLQEEYSSKCALDDQEARNQLSREKAGQQQVKLAERDSAKREQQRAMLRADQCNNMRDVIAVKRKRESALNPTEVTALRELEHSYNERCIAR